MSDAAKSTWSTAEITPKCTTTDRALQERLSAVENAQTEDRHTQSNQESVMFEITAWEVQLLAGGGYNYVWLVCYTVTHRASSLAFPPLLQTNCFKRCRTVPRHFCLKVHDAYNTKQSASDSPYIAMEFIDGQPLDLLWLRLDRTRKSKHRRRSGGYHCPIV